MATPSINNLIKYINSKITGLNWNTNFQQIVNWFTDGNADVSFNTIEGELTGDVTGNLTGDVVGDLTGNVTGNLTGNVTGNLTGNVTGDVTGDIYASNGTSKILENGTTGTNAIITADVVGDTITARTTNGSVLIKNSSGSTIATFTNSLTMQGTLEGTFKRIASTTIAGSATNAVNLTDLSGNTDKQYILKAKIKSGANESLYFRVNSDSTANYATTYVLFWTTTTYQSATGEAFARLGNDTPVNEVIDLTLELNVQNIGGYITFSGHAVKTTGGTNETLMLVGGRKQYTAEVTSINLYSSAGGNLFAVGSEIELQARR